MKMRVLLVVMVMFGSLATVTNRAEAAGDPPEFTDVLLDTYYGYSVRWLVHEGITTGITPTTFEPDGLVTRGQMATFLFRASGDAAPASLSHSFTDVPASAFFAYPVQWLVNKGVTMGTTATTFSPNQVVNRGQMAVFMWRLMGEPAPNPSGPAIAFSDVPASAYYANAVKWLVSERITLGLSATHFAPDSPVTRAQMAVFLRRLAGRPLFEQITIGPDAELANVYTQMRTDRAVAILTEVFGPPSTDTGWIEGCPLDDPGALNERDVKWGNLMAHFARSDFGGDPVEGSLRNWGYDIRSGPIVGGPPATQIDIVSPGFDFGDTMAALSLGTGYPLEYDSTFDITVMGRGFDFEVLAFGNNPTATPFGAYVPFINSCE